MKEYFDRPETTGEERTRFTYSCRNAGENYVPDIVAEEEQPVFMTRAEVIEIIDRKIAAIKVYVSEADITEAQDRVKAIVEYSRY